MNPIDLLGWRLTGLRNRAVDRYWEWKLGVDTGGQRPVSHPDANRYGTFTYRSIFRILKHVNLTPHDVLVDIGCGKGRVVCCAAMQNIKEVIGVDVDAELCEEARANLAAMPGRKAEARIMHAPAEAFDYTACTVFYLFNSFGEETLRKVLDSIERSLDANPRPFRFMYVNPFYDHVLEQARHFRRYDRWERRPWSGLKFNVTFWTNRDRG